MRLRLHHFLPHSHANGPGVRAVVWVQGCSLACPGCFNPDTHSPRGGRLVEVGELVEQIAGLGETIEGITVSGGEPLQQRPAVTELLRRVKSETALSVILFTGFSWAEVLRLVPPLADTPTHRYLGSRSIPELLDYVDVLIAGRYDQSRHLARGLRGSSNKTVHFLTDRYTLDDLESVPAAEVVVTTTGDVLCSGIEPVNL